MAKKISGLTIAINADTSGVTKGLGDISEESKKLSANLKAVDSLLKLDPTNTDLLAERQKLLSSSIETTSKKLEQLKAAQDDVNKALSEGKISDSEYIAFQKEIVYTEKRLNDLKAQEDNTGKSTKKLDEDTSKLSDTLKSGLAAGAQAAAAAVAAVGAAAVAAVTSVVKLADETAKLGDDIDKQSQKMGLSSEAYQEWSFIMQHSGSDIDKMSTAMQKLADAATDPSDSVTEAFQKIGMSIDEVKGMDQQELFAATITALQGMEDETERAAAAKDILGNASKDLGALLNTSAEDTEAMRQQVHDLGGVMSGEAVKSAAAYEDSLLNMNTAIDGIKNGIASNFIPAITTVMDGVTDVLSGSEDGIDTVKQGINDFATAITDTVGELKGKFSEIGQPVVDALSQILPDILTLGTDLVLDLLKGIATALPDVAKTAVTIVLQLVDGILKMLPDLLKAGVDVIVALVGGIAKALPQLLPAAVKAITAIVKGLTDSIPDLIAAAMALILALADGLIKAIPELLTSLPQIITSLLNGILGAIPQVIQTGIKLLTALTGALPDIIATIVQVLPQIITAIIGALMENLPLIINAGFDLMSALLGNLPGIIAEIVTAIPLIIAAIWQAVSEFYPQMGEYGLQLFQQLTSRGEEIKTKIQELIPKIITGIADAFMEKYNDLQNMGMNIFDNVAQGIQSVLSNAWNWGSDLISNFVSGITENISKVVSAATNIGQTIKDYIGFSEPDKGPLSDFHTFAPDMMQLFANGIADNTDIVANEFNDSLKAIGNVAKMDGISAQYGRQSAISNSALSPGATTQTINVNVSVGSIASDYDVNRMTDQMIMDISAGLAQLKSRQSALIGV